MAENSVISSIQIQCSLREKSAYALTQFSESMGVEKERLASIILENAVARLEEILPSAAFSDSEETSSEVQFDESLNLSITVNISGECVQVNQGKSIIANQNVRSKC